MEIGRGFAVNGWRERVVAFLSKVRSGCGNHLQGWCSARGERCGGREFVVVIVALGGVVETSRIAGCEGLFRGCGKVL